MTGHIGLAEGRWFEMSLFEQLGNVGAEVGRAIRAKSRDNDARFDAAFDRALELFDLTLADPRWDLPRLREIARARETSVDFLFGDNEYNSSAASIDRYFTSFAVAARTRRDIAQAESRRGSSGS
jgi:hypothetical protein